MSEYIDKLVPEAVQKLIPYQSARRIGGNGRVWLNANELEDSLPLGDDVVGMNRYPDFMPQQIASAYLKYAGITSDCIAVRGADEAIDLLIRTFCKPGADKILVCSPTYAMYNFCAEALAIETIDVPLDADFNLAVTDVIEQAQRANLVFLCSPNNPTGNVIERSSIEAVLEGTKHSSIVVVDEAYIEFELQTSVADLIERYPHLVVIRTLSKAFGLAAVRCGFILADRAVMQYVEKLIPPYPMPDCSSKIVLQALSNEGLDVVASSTQKLIETREWFRHELEKVSVVEKVYPSSTNFVLVKCLPGVELFEWLKQNGIVTRNQTHEPLLKSCIRITIGTPASMEEVINTLNAYPVNA